MKKDAPLMVSVSLGLTIPVGPYQVVKPTIEVRNILVDQPGPPQIEASLGMVRQAWVAIEDEIEVRVLDLLAEKEEGAPVKDRLDSIEQRLGKVEKRRDVHDKVKGLEAV